MKKKYELMVIISAEISDADIEKRLQGLKELLGEIVYEELWGMRPFAYKIKKQDKGYYAVWNFMKLPDEIHELEQNLQLYPDLLRFLLMHVPADYTPISLKAVEEGLEKLKKEKAEKRGGKGLSKKESKELKEEKAPKIAAKELSPAPPPPAAVPVTPAEPKAEEKKEEKKPEKKEKTFDEKLSDILSDDDLGL